MRKKLLAVFVSVMLAFSVGAVMTVNAGITENKPAGNGLLNAAGELNDTSFKILETQEGDADAYAPQKGNMALTFDGSFEPRSFVLANPIEANSLQEDSVISYSFNVYEMTSGGQFMFAPLASKAMGDTRYVIIITCGGNGGLVIARRANTPEGDSDKVKAVNPANNTEYATLADAANAGYSVNNFNAMTAKYDYATFFFDVSINTEGYTDVLISHGYAEKDGTVKEKINDVIVKNWSKYDASKDAWMTSWMIYPKKAVVDDIRIVETHEENQKDVSTVIQYFDVEDNTKIAETSNPEGKNGYLLSEGITAKEIYVGATSETGIIATNPAEGSGIVTRAELATDKSLATNLKLDTKFALRALSEGQKVGLGFGYESSRQLTGAHKFLYFTVTDGKVMFGGESVDKTGPSTALFESVEVTDATVGEEAPAIDVKLTGKGANLEIKVGTNEAFTVENFDPDGFFAVTHKGAGNLTYMICDNLTMTGYEFVENEEGAAAISSNFTGNYINGNKFQSKSSISPETHIVKGDKTTHDIAGMVAENGKLGFYGTSTGTRLLTNKKYADFVMQFDYISHPTLQRGQLVSPTRYSAAYMMFGMKEGGLPLNDSSVYSLGIYEGIADPAMYGDNETVITSLGAAGACGAGTVGTAKLKKTTTQTDTSIPRYNAGGYDATKANKNVMEWYDADPEGTTYSFYNKVTRVKLVVVNNQVALYAAEVNSETGEVGEYKKLISFTAKDTEGYLGIGSDSPAWFEIDNLAITPVSREKAIELGADVELSATGIVNDIAPADMANDPMPSPLAKPQLTADTANKKVKWNAVDGAADYEVTVKLGNETVLEQTVTATEIDLSSLTAEGTYKVTVKANPSDADNYLASRENIDYVVAGGSGGDSGNGGDQTPDASGDEEKGGCGCGKSSAATAGAIAACVAVTAVVMIKRR